MRECSDPARCSPLGTSLRSHGMSRALLLTGLGGTLRAQARAGREVLSLAKLGVLVAALGRRSSAVHTRTTELYETCSVCEPCASWRLVRHRTEKRRGWLGVARHLNVRACGCAPRSSYSLAVDARSSMAASGRLLLTLRPPVMQCWAPLMRDPRRSMRRPASIRRRARPTTRSR